MSQHPITLALIDSPVGVLVAGATDDAIVLLSFADEHTPREDIIAAYAQRFEQPAAEGETAHLTMLRAELDAYFAGTQTTFSVPVAYDGSPFQKQVWGELLNIPYGETRSYQDIADAVGMPTATRAVGMTNGMNPIAIVIPCHRVVNSGGALGGYGGGLWRKRHLLDLEHGQRGLGF